MTLVCYGALEIVGVIIIIIIIKAHMVAMYVLHVIFKYK